MRHAKHAVAAMLLILGTWALTPATPSGASAYGCTLAGGTTIPPQPWYNCQDLNGSGLRVNSSTSIFQATTAFICNPQARFRYTPRSTGSQVTFTTGVAGTCGAGLAAYGQWFGFDMKNNTSMCAAQKNSLNGGFSVYQCHQVHA